jgi:hypothetical protein
MAMTGAGLAELRQQYVDAVAAPQTNDAASATTHCEALRRADSNAIVDYITQNAELVPVSTDSGTAGSGIITGKVK